MQKLNKDCSSLSFSYLLCDANDVRLMLIHYLCACVLRMCILSARFVHNIGRVSILFCICMYRALGCNVIFIYFGMNHTEGSFVDAFVVIVFANFFACVQIDALV